MVNREGSGLLTSEDVTPVMPQKELMISSLESPSAMFGRCVSVSGGWFVVQWLSMATDARLGCWECGKVTGDQVGE